MCRIVDAAEGFISLDQHQHAEGTTTKGESSENSRKMNSKIGTIN